MTPTGTRLPGPLAVKIRTFLEGILQSEYAVLS
jgi:hypothetical protein